MDQDKNNNVEFNMDRVTRVMNPDELAEMLSMEERSDSPSSVEPSISQYNQAYYHPEPESTANANSGGYSRRRRNSSGTSRSNTSVSRSEAGNKKRTSSGGSGGGSGSSGKKNASSGKKKSRKKKSKEEKSRILVWFKRFLLFILGLILLGILATCVFVFSIIKDTPPIDPQQIYDHLAETTKMYDDQGVELDTIYFGSNREMASINDMPENLTNAIIALEDKSFRSHHGFNVIRMVGAIVDALRTGGQISGTSTITQQLARNIYLQETQFDRNIKRKIQEAYYALRLEKELSKDEIIEAYLNAIYFGYNSFGVETAAQNYFGKNVKDLTLAECAALAALPQMPDTYQLIVFEEGGTAAAYPDTALYEDIDGVYLANDKSKDRRDLCLDLMLEQGYITQQEHDVAIATPITEMLNPDFSAANSNAAYFADYCISEVIQDLMDEKGMDSDTAWATVYQGGLEIHSTLDSDAQSIVMSEFSNPYNYPWVEPSYDDDGNIIDDNGNIKLYDYDNFFDDNGNFVLDSEEYEFMSDGSLKIFYGNTLYIYTTEVAEGIEYSLEFPGMYYYDDASMFYSISGGYINVPRVYKTINGENDLIISAEFINDPDYEGWFTTDEDGNLLVSPQAYSLNQKTIQPQVAMTIVENETGHIKAMVGGRNTSGRMIYNRAVSPRQPGSSIKPLGVYSAALQQSVEEMKAGKVHEFKDFGIDTQGASMYGDYMTAASIIVDEETTIEGKKWPVNFSNTFSGPQTMRVAMRESINTCAVKIWYQVGAEYSLNNIKKFGITTLVEEGPVNDINASALALGGTTHGVTTLEMASAYTVFPNNGVRYAPSSYTQVLDKDGNVLLENNPEPERVLDEGVAWIMADMLHDVVESGTATNAYVPNTFVGGKTGTTSDEKDDWFDGFTQTYSASLWIGSDIAIDLSDSSVVATVLWGNIMRQIDGAYGGERKEQPESVVRYAGEYFVDGTQKGLYSLQNTRTIHICNESGMLATPSCPSTQSREYNPYLGNFTPPAYYCHIHNTDPSTYPVGPDYQQAIESQTAQEAEEQARLEEEERQRMEAEEQARIEEEERLRLEEEERLRQEEEARIQEEEERIRQEEEERIRQEEEAAQQAAEQEAEGGGEG